MRDNDDYKLGDLYNDNILNEKTIDELFSPSQRSVGGKLKDMVGGAVSKITGGARGNEAASRNKLVKKYQEVWAEYEKYVTSQKGVGAKTDFGMASARQFLTDIGVPDPTINSVIQAGAQNYTQDRRGAGNLIYSVLQAVYGAQASPTTYQLSPTL